MRFGSPETGGVAALSRTVFRAALLAGATVPGGWDCPVREPGGWV